MSAQGLLPGGGALGDRVSIGAVGASFSLIIYSGYLVQMFFDWLSQFEEALVGVERLNEYLRLPLEKGAGLPASAKFLTDHPREKSLNDSILQAPTQTLSLKAVSLAYSHEGPLILKDISLNFAPGRKYGIIGRTGSGKSSLVQVLLGLYPPTSGEITYGNRILFEEDLPLAPYRELFSFVSQEPFLFAGSLRENLCLDHLVSDDRLIEVLKEVGWSQDPSLAHLNLAIEEKGKNLSSGERQLISFARAILNPKKFVILDEATSSIDPAHEELLFRSLKKNTAGTTLIAIAHKLSQLSDFDEIIWLDQGRLHKIAPPSEVLNEFLATDLSAL
jgi:ABC-type multidrug transport system fused ATPase/permease subunit